MQTDTTKLLTTTLTEATCIHVLEQLDKVSSCIWTASLSELLIEDSLSYKIIVCCTHVHVYVAEWLDDPQ